MDFKRSGISLVSGFVTVFAAFVLFSCQGVQGKVQVAADVPRPTFPDSFEVEVQGFFREERAEVEGRIHYDKPSNRAVFSYTYKGQSQTSIYRFNTSEFILINGSECSVNKITDDVGGSFFPFALTGNQGKTLASPEDVFYFSKSVFERQETITLPTYVFTGNIDMPKYGRSKCDIIHVFSKPEVEWSTCEDYACRSILTDIAVSCPQEEKLKKIDHAYQFYHFRNGIRDPEVFQPPSGVHCTTNSRGVHIPSLPQYFSLSYHITQDMGNAEALGVYSYQRKVWYDSKLSLIRIDEFDFNGLLESSRIFDFYGGVLYSTVASISNCSTQPIVGEVSLNEMTMLPKIFFSKTPTSEEAVYVGQRYVNGMLHYTWSSSFTDEKTNAMNVQEFYFSKIVLDNEGSSQLKPSHVDTYIYENRQRSALSRLTISNFRSNPKEWEAFDVSPCYRPYQKKGFRLKVSGPDIVEYSYVYEELLEKMYVKLIIATNVSVIRISELKGKFDGFRITEFAGWILEKPISSGSMTGEVEPDMLTAYKIIEKAASEGKLSIKVKKLGQEIKYDVTAIEEVPIPPLDSKKDCFSGGALAATGLVLLMIGLTIGIIGYHVFLKKKTPLADDKVQLSSILS